MHAIPPSKVNPVPLPTRSKWNPSHFLPNAVSAGSWWKEITQSQKPLFFSSLFAVISLFLSVSLRQPCPSLKCRAWGWRRKWGISSAPADEWNRPSLLWPNAGEWLRLWTEKRWCLVKSTLAGVNMSIHDSLLFFSGDFEGTLVMILDRLPSICSITTARAGWESYSECNDIFW